MEKTIRYLQEKIRDLNYELNYGDFSKDNVEYNPIRIKCYTQILEMIEKEIREESKEPKVFVSQEMINAWEDKRKEDRLELMYLDIKQNLLHWRKNGSLSYFTNLKHTYNKYKEEGGTRRIPDLEEKEFFEFDPYKFSVEAFEEYKNKEKKLNFDFEIISEKYYNLKQLHADKEMFNCLRNMYEKYKKDGGQEVILDFETK